MIIALLTLHDISDFPIEDWLDLSKHQVVIFADQESQRPQAVEKALHRGIAGVQLYSNYINNGLIEFDLVSMHRARPFDAIISFGEDDVIRAARLREYLGMAGQSVTSATAYRDKLRMKQAVQDAGLQVPKFTALNSPLDVLAFRRIVGLPYFVKPRTSSGSTMARSIPDEAALRTFLAEEFKARIPFSEYVPDLMLEELVIGQLYHIDGFVFAGKVITTLASRYGSATLELGAIGSEGAVFSYSLAPENETASKLLDYTAKVIKSLDSPSSFSFHAEVFIQEDGNLLLCEIACRTGGGRINDAYRAATGFDLNQLSFLAQCDLDHVGEILSHAPHQPQARHTASSLVCPKRARLIRTPTECPLPGVRGLKVHVEPGHESDERHYSGDRIASAIIVGDSEAETVTRVRAFNHWFTSEYLEIKCET